MHLMLASVGLEPVDALLQSGIRERSGDFLERCNRLIWFASRKMSVGRKVRLLKAKRSAVIRNRNRRQRLKCTLRVSLVHEQ